VHLHVFEFYHSSLVLWNTRRANLKPSTFKVSEKVQTNFRSINKILIISIFMKLSHVCVYELCHSRLDIGLLVPTSSPQLSKFHKMSNGSNELQCHFFHLYLFLNSLGILSTTFFLSTLKACNPICHTLLCCKTCIIKITMSNPKKLVIKILKDVINTEECHFLGHASSRIVIKID
jgi:hypothetical protein